jgi:hypothetical protein
VVEVVMYQRTTDPVAAVTLTLRRATWWTGSAEGDDGQEAEPGARGSWFCLEEERITIPTLDATVRCGQHYALSLDQVDIPDNHPEYVGIE